MDRRQFLHTSALGAAAVTTMGPTQLLACGKRSERKQAAPLRLSFQEGTAPGSTLGEKLDYMERLGIVGFEPGGKGLPKRVDEIKSALKGRNISVSAICAGFGGFILAEDPSVKAEFDSTMRDIVRAAGELGSVGVIMVPAFNRQSPCMPNTQETWDYLCGQLHDLGEFALSQGTTVILEPLNRREAFYLRQVSVAAAIARDSQSAGVKVMGDFWHMQEETSDYAAFMSAGTEYLRHVHIASRGRRLMPGEDAEKDCYMDGFRALKEMSYQGFVSFECGTKGDRDTTVRAAVELLRRQWEEA